MKIGAIVSFRSDQPHRQRPRAGRVLDIDSRQHRAVVQPLFDAEPSEDVPLSLCRAITGRALEEVTDRLRMVRQLLAALAPLDRKTPSPSRSVATFLTAC